MWNRRVQVEKRKWRKKSNNGQEKMLKLKYTSAQPENPLLSTSALNTHSAHPEYEVTFSYTVPVFRSLKCDQDMYPPNMNHQMLQRAPRRLSGLSAISSNT
ncbi:unnamed protein product [Cuscuta europaea]|uniref:Uncharacterized protein n=1 Tax=Cuscuta europaea TaxID=41803 RepID=A0A9P0ZFD2_CUSEU|nr:unnamed protein product [Cuscuta europaea]